MNKGKYIKWGDGILDITGDSQSVIDIKADDMRLTSTNEIQIIPSFQLMHVMSKR